MIQSMTGFGRGEATSSVQEGASFRMQVEIKSVNHRYGEVVVRMPKTLLVLEERVRRLVSAKLQRGRVDVFISFEEVGSKAANVQVDYELAKAYFQAGQELAAQLGLPQTLTVEQLLRYPDIIKVSEVQEDAENRWPVLQEALEAALAQLLAMRRQEGCNLQEDFARRIALLRERLQTVEARAPQVACEYQEKLLLKLRELLAAAGTAPDESRVLQEAALFAQLDQRFELCLARFLVGQRWLRADLRQNIGGLGLRRFVVCCLFPCHDLFPVSVPLEKP